MTGSPISNWENAAAVFTFADNPAALGFFLTLAVGLCVGTIAAMVVHEKKSFER